MKKVVIHPHAEARMQERGATEIEVIDTIQNGEYFPAKFGRLGFRRNFVYKKQWRNKVFKRYLLWKKIWNILLLQL